MGFDKDEIQIIKQLLGTPKNIVITTHYSPDGDAIGSSLGLYNFLIQANHQTIVITPNDYPKFIHWLPGDETIIDAEKKSSLAEEKIKNADIIFALDYNALKRTDKLEPFIRQSNAKKIMIDHHQQPEDFADFTFSFPNTCSTSQLIYEFIDALGDASKVNQDVASCLYTGIMTDTGSFRFNSVAPLTHFITAKLLETGIKHDLIHGKVMDSNSFERMKLIGYALSQKMVYLKEYNAVYMSLEQKEMEQYNFQAGDTEGLVNYGLSIAGVKIAAFFAEKNGDIKMSFRSKGDVDVNIFARQHFNGGGHQNAAGGITKKPLEATIKKFISLLPTI
jgi:bifunctional oligoribonuclease and PAP phosphatase NrnA